VVGLPSTVDRIQLTELLSNVIDSIAVAASFVYACLALSLLLPMAACAAELEPTNRRERTLYAGPVYVHTHTSTFAHSNSSRHVGRVHIRCPYKPGMGAVPEADANIDTFCDDLYRQLEATTRTLDVLHGQAESTLEARTVDVAAEGVDTVVGQRAVVNSSLDAQMQLQQGIMEAWLQDPARSASA
jgi:hypothetical protein